MEKSCLDAPQTKPHRRVTISDMSEALGLTKSTISRALNGYSDISEATRLRVNHMAEKMHYRPLSHAQAIRTGRARAIGLVIERSEHDAHRPFLADFLAGISKSLSAEGWTLTVSASESPQETLATLEKLSADKKADGFILPRTLRHDPRIQALHDQNIPMILFGRTDGNVNCAWYDIDGAEAMRKAVLHLAGLGHERIAFLNGGSQYNYSYLREEGFRNGLAEAEIDADPALIRQNCLHRKEGFNAAIDILSSAEPPTAFIAALDQVALGIYDAAQALDLEIGRDLSVIGYDGIMEGASCQPPLSTFAVNIQRAGERLAALLMRSIRGEASDNLQELEQASFLERGSTAPPGLSPEQLKKHIRSQIRGKQSTNRRKPK